MPTKTFFSFHYTADNWRASQIRNMGIVEGNAVVTDNDWESVKRGGDAAIQRWIDGQIAGRACGVVLIGSATAGRKWIKYEIEKCWNEGKGLLGIHVHNLKDQAGNQSLKGSNPFNEFTLRNGALSLSAVVPTYDPPYGWSTDVYAYIQSNLAAWISNAISVRGNFKG